MSSQAVNDEVGAALLASWRAGSGEAGEQFVDMYFDVVLRFYRNKVPSDPEVDGLVGETFELCRTTSAPYVGRGPLKAWIFTIARRVLAKFFKHKLRRHTEELPDDLSSSSVDGREPAAALLIKGDDLRLALKAIRQISILQQTVIELRLIEELKLEHIAEVLGIPRGTVSSRWREGLEALRTKMAEIERSPEKFNISTHSLQSWIREIKTRLDDSMDP